MGNPELQHMEAVGLVEKLYGEVMQVGEDGCDIAFRSERGRYPPRGVNAVLRTAFGEGVSITPHDDLPLALVKIALAIAAYMCDPNGMTTRDTPGWALHDPNNQWMIYGIAARDVQELSDHYGVPDAIIMPCFYVLDQYRDNGTLI